MKLEVLRKVKQEIDIEKDPDNFAPSFRPNTQISQQNVKGRTTKEGFGSFLNELNTWKMRKDKKLNELKMQQKISDREIFTHKPRLNENSKKINSCASSSHLGGVFDRLAEGPSADFLLKREQRVE